MDLEIQGFEIGTFRFQTRCTTTELTRPVWKFENSFYWFAVFGKHEGSFSDKKNSDLIFENTQYLVFKDLSRFHTL